MKLTKHEAQVLSLYTDILFCSFSDMHEYAESILGRPIFSHEFANLQFAESLQDAVASEAEKIFANMEIVN